VIGCIDEANDCDMVYRLQYQIGNGSIKTLGQWREVYEGQEYPISIDLSTLRGENVKFILSVLSNGSAHEDFALWINPRISRQSSDAPTPTSRVAIPTYTPTATPTFTATATATSTATPTPTVTP
jgi:hypothetical protein